MLVLTPGLPPERGGIQLLSARLAERLPSLQLTVLAPALASLGAASGDPLDLRRPHRFTARLHGRSRIALLNAFALRVAAGRRFDLVLCMHVALAPAARAIGALGGPVYVLYVYASELPARPKLARWAIGGACQVIAISSFSRTLAIGLGADPEVLVLIEPGVDRAAATEPHGDLEPVVIAVARVDEAYKGHDVLIRAMPLVRSQVPAARCVVVGEGQLLPGCRRLAESIGAGDYIDFRGALDDAARDRALREASVFCLPVREPPSGAGEGFGIAFLEAGSAGLPVVAGRTGGASDAVVDGQTGILVDDPNDHGAVAEAIVSLLADRERAGELGRAGRAHAARHSWEAMAAAVERVCLDAIEERA